MTAEFRIDHNAEGPFAELADETWLRVTDDFPIAEGEDFAEFFFRMGMLSAFQLAGQAQSDPGSRASERVREAVTVAVSMLEDES